jgi:uncharacterized OB-fold protein
MAEPGPAELVLRPLPHPSISSESFWTSGADGRLRIAECQACSGYHHPPQPICPRCRSVEVAMMPVSGRATIAGFTVNHQQWLPRFPPPYVVAVVAIAEDLSTQRYPRGGAAAATGALMQRTDL